MKRFKVTYELMMELPDDTEIVVPTEFGGEMLALDGRLFCPFELVWAEGDADGTQGSVVEDDETANALCPVGTISSWQMTLDPAE